MTGAELRPLRKDASRNKALVIAAASEVFAKCGLEASYDQIARSAGVGVGTVYRRFPLREELQEAVLTSALDRIQRLAQDALANDDSWTALTTFFEDFVLEQRVNLGLTQLVARGDLASERLSRHRDQLIASVDQLIARAQRDGSARRDLSVLDFVVMITLVVGIAIDDDSDLWRRYFELLLDGLRAEPTRATPPGPEPTDADVKRLLRRR